MILKVYTDDCYDQGIDVPVTPQSTVSDILGCCREPHNGHCHLVETWRNHERIVGVDERLFEVLMHWGDLQDEVRFHLRQNYDENMKLKGSDKYSSLEDDLREGPSKTYREMQNWAVQQNHLIRQQQQMILAKEQRLRFLRQQEHLHNQQMLWNQTERETADRIEQYKKKMQQLKCTRGEVFAQTSINQAIANDLDSYRQSFSVTEKELSSVITKADMLSKQLQAFQNTRCEPSISEECQRLRSELILRKKLNEEQNRKVVIQNQTLVKRKEEVAELDARIAKLQDHVRQASHKKLDGSKSRHGPLGAFAAKVEPYVLDEALRISPSDIPGPSKLDARYQSLPSNRRVPTASLKKDPIFDSDVKKEPSFGPRSDQLVPQNKGLKLDVQNKPSLDLTVHSQEKKQDEEMSSNGLSSSLLSSAGTAGSKGYSSLASRFSSSSSVILLQSQPKVVTALVAGSSMSRTTSSPLTMDNGPITKHVATMNPEVLPMQLMPPFTASIVFPSKNSQSPVYTFAGGKESGQLTGLQSQESNAFQRSPSGRYHFDANSQEVSTGVTAVVSSTSAQMASISPPPGGSSFAQVQLNHTQLARSVVSRTDAGVGYPPGRQNDARQTNNFIPMTYVEQQALQMEFKPQTLGTESKTPLPKTYNLQPNEPYRFQKDEKPIHSGISVSPSSDSYSRPQQLRFASMNVISNTYFRRPGSSNIEPKRTEERVDLNSRIDRTQEQPYGPSVMASHSPSSPTTLIWPIQNMAVPQSTSGYYGNATQTSDLNRISFKAAHHSNHLSGKDMPKPNQASMGFMNALVADSKENMSSRNKSTTWIPVSDAPRVLPSSRQVLPSPYQMDKSGTKAFLPNQLYNVPRTIAGDYNNLPVRKESKRISFSDEHFIPTNDALYQLDGYGAYYNSMRHAIDTDKSPGHQKHHAPRPLRRRLSGESNDDSFTRPVKYQQQQQLDSVAATNPLQPPLNEAMSADYLQGPANAFRMAYEPQYSNSFSSSVLPPPDALLHQAPSLDSNTSSALPPVSSSYRDASPLHVSNSPLISKSPPVISNSSSSVISKSPNVPNYSIASADLCLSSGAEITVSPSISVVEVSSPRSQPSVLISSPAVSPVVSDATPLFMSASSVASPSLTSLPVSVMVSSPSSDVSADSSSNKSQASQKPKVDDDHGETIDLKEAEQPLEGEPDPVPLFVADSSTSKRSNLKKSGSGQQTANRVTFDPLVLLLDACLEGELEVVMRTAQQVDDPSVPNDEGITALHNAICAGHFPVVKFLVEYGCDVNAADTDGWTPLHCAASCNNLEMTRLLVENGASLFAVTTSDQESASQKCEQEEEGFDGCSKYLLEMEEKLGTNKFNHGLVYALYDYNGQTEDELSFQCGDKITVLRKGDDTESLWWYSRLQKKEGYIPRNYFGAYSRITPKWLSAR